MKKVYGSKTTDLEIYQLGSRIVNWYLIDSSKGVVLIDTGFAGHWSQFVQGLKQLNKTIDQVQAVLLTHAHMDHTGFAERARQRTSAKVYIHYQDAKAVKYEHRDIPTELIRNLWRPSTFLNFLSGSILQGALGGKPVREFSTFQDQDNLNLPGSPQVLLTPGHTIGHCAFYFAKEKVLFSGDALCTRSPITLRDHPPHVMKVGDDKNLAMRSLEKLKALEDILLLPGHGAPWQGNIVTSILQAQKTGPIL